MSQYVSLARAAEAAGLRKHHNAMRYYAAQGRIKGAIYREPTSPKARGAWSIPLSVCEHGVDSPWIKDKQHASRRICIHE